MRIALAAVAVCAVPALSGQVADENESPASRTEASQIEMPQAATGPGSAYLESAAHPAAPPQPRASLVEARSDGIIRGKGSAPASQISARGDGGPGIAQLSKADLEATLAQLSPAERRVLLQAIEGTDICNDPPDIPAVVTLCQNRIETRSTEFAPTSERSLSAEDRLLSGNLESAALPSIAQVIDRLARGGASSGDFSNQAIASIALGTTPAAPARPREEEQPDTASFGEETQALLNALINQLGGRAP
ncbi:hypothetical protein [Erythrobacter donghaensis]|uniref:hypothetical protein n=1 Tax=Erythrobacter donghaensis TaxID=267135 RepID=UPI000A39EB9F|nr:hypothetical protein [Erythrobacter donghaensis]